MFDYLSLDITTRAAVSCDRSILRATDDSKAHYSTAPIERHKGQSGDKSLFPDTDWTGMKDKDDRALRHFWTTLVSSPLTDLIPPSRKKGGRHSFSLTFPRPPTHVHTHQASVR